MCIKFSLRIIKNILHKIQKAPLSFLCGAKQKTKGTIVMKKTGYLLFLTPMLVALCIGIYYILTPFFDNGNLNQSQPPKDSHADSSPDITSSKDSYVRADASGEDSQSSVTHSMLSGYLMTAESENICIYEEYSNGYKEKIKTLDINPKYMRKDDYLALKQGIRVSSYTEICSLIEDFSS